MIKKSSYKRDQHKNTEETVLAIDYGEVRTGVAFGRNGYVSPLKIIPSKDVNRILNEIARLVIQNKISKVVVGLPLTYEGKETSQTRKVRTFSNLLKIRLKKPVTYVNEYGTTQESKEEAIDYGLSKKKRRKIDHLSAAVILKKYFSEGESAQP